MSYKDFYVNINGFEFMAGDVMFIIDSEGETLLEFTNGNVVQLKEPEKYRDEILEKKINFHKNQRLVQVENGLMDVEDAVKKRVLLDVEELESNIKTSLSMTESKISSVRQSISALDVDRVAKIIPKLEGLYKAFKKLVD